MRCSIRRKPPGAAERLVDILSLRGRLWKDEIPPRARRRGCCPEGRARAAEYRRPTNGRAIPPAINAATLAAILGDRNEAERLAREIGAARTARPPHLLGARDRG
jgi:hypothetical protein